MHHGYDQWLTMPDGPADPEIRQRCRIDPIQHALDHLDDVEVVSATLNTTGELGLPDYCDVRVRQLSTGGHVVNHTVWVPLQWNQRFMGTGGTGNRTTVGMHVPPYFRIITVPVAVRNGFAAATSDGGNQDARLVDWAFRGDSYELNLDLIRDWAFRSTHDMTVIGKTVAQAIHGAAPRFSYFQGCSGGGRQAMMQAQRYPQDYDGIWASDPAINWTKFIPAMLWPALVMQEEHNPLPPAKLEAFRAAAGAARGGLDPTRLVGAQTSAGLITNADAVVMARIWAGPQRASGEPCWYGLRPGTQSWGDELDPGAGLCSTQLVDGEHRPAPPAIAESWMRWVARDPHLSLGDLSYTRFEELFDRGVTDFADLATDDPDLHGLRDHGAKLILSHGAADDVVLVDGSIDYYRRVVEAMGGMEQTATFARLFISEGDGHGTARLGPGLSLAAGMRALMNWVENGIAPDEVHAETFDLHTGEVLASRPVHAYPRVPRADATNVRDNAKLLGC